MKHIKKRGLTINHQSVCLVRVLWSYWSRQPDTPPLSHFLSFLLFVRLISHNLNSTKKICMGIELTIICWANNKEILNKSFKGCYMKNESFADKGCYLLKSSFDPFKDLFQGWINFLKHFLYIPLYLQNLTQDLICLSFGAFPTNDTKSFHILQCT